MSEYEIFITGETIDLALPSEKAIVEDGWHTWLNDPIINRYTGHGKIPNTAAKQRVFLEGLLDPQSDRFGLLVIDKESEKAIGIVSLSSIDLAHRKADTALIIGSKKRSPNAIFQGLEAKARIVEHGFEKLGLERIQGGQVVALEDWQRFQVLFGFRPEGINRKSYRSGQEVFDAVMTACLLEDYQRIIDKRGSYWPGKRKLLELMRGVPKDSIVANVGKVIDEAVKDYQARIGNGTES